MLAIFPVVYRAGGEEQDSEDSMTQPSILCRICKSDQEESLEVWVETRVNGVRLFNDAFEGDYVAVLCYSLPLRCDHYARAIRVRRETIKLYGITTKFSNDSQQPEKRHISANFGTSTGTPAVALTKQRW